MITIAGFHLPEVHLLKRRLILIGLSNVHLRHRFDPRVRIYDLGPGFWGVVIVLTCSVTISMCESVSRRGEDWRNWWSLQALQVR